MAIPNRPRHSRQPVTYSVDGKQYIAVPSGWDGWIKGFAAELYSAPRDNALFVFTLSDYLKRIGPCQSSIYQSLIWAVG